MELLIDSLITANGSMEEYQDKVVIEGFSRQEEADPDVTLTPVAKGFSQDEGVALDGLMHAPTVLDFSINKSVLMLDFSKFSADFNFLFERLVILVLALYADEFIVAGNLKQFMMWCEKMLTNDDGMRGKEGFQFVDAVFLV